MTIVFGTLGYTPEKLLPTVAAHKDVRKVVFFHDRVPESQNAARRVEAFCADRKLPVRAIALDAFDIIASAKEMRKAVRDEPRDEVIFNISGGTPVLSAAATLVCILEGLRAVYLHKHSPDEIQLPLLKIDAERFLNDEQARVLRFIMEQGDTGCQQGDIGQALGLSRSTVSYHVGHLREKRLVREVRQDDARKLRLFARESASLLLEDGP